MRLSEALKTMLATGSSADALVAFVEQWEQRQASPRPSRQKNAYTTEFEAFWKAYPTDPGMSKYEAWQVWEKTDPVERDLAMKAIGPFKQWLKSQPKDYRVIHACRFLSKKRYEGHSQQLPLRVVSSTPMKWVSRDSAEWGTFAESYKAIHGKYPPVDNKGGWFFPEKLAEAS